MPELSPIFYIGSVLLIILLAFGAWIYYTEDGRFWLANLERRVENLQKKNRARVLPTFQLDHERMSAFRREMQIQRINTKFDTLRLSYDRVIRDPARREKLIAALEEARKKELAEIDVS